MFLNIINYLFNDVFLYALHIENKYIFPKPLTKKEENEAFELMIKGNENARTRLIEHNLRLVAHIIKKYYSNLKEQDELISIGTVGLIKAVSTFDYTKGNRFATYASRCIENEILMHFRSKKKTASDVYIDEPIETDKDGNQFPHSLYTSTFSFIKNYQKSLCYHFLKKAEIKFRNIFFTVKFVHKIGLSLCTATVLDFRTVDFNCYKILDNSLKK